MEEIMMRLTTMPNPPFGAVFTYHPKDDIETGPEIDNSTGKPEYDKLREKERTRTASVQLLIRDEDGAVAKSVEVLKAIAASVDAESA